uniref:Oxidoreductase dhs-27 n=1 Tax=Ascaris suum TaxID=6253 RepID=F1L7R1_ASCSU
MNIGEMFVSPNLEMQHIDDTSFTFGWVLKALNEMDHDWINISSGRKVKNILANNIANGKGFSSYIYKLTLEFNYGKPYYVVLKVPTLEILLKEFEGKNLDANFMNNFIENAMTLPHLRECNFYRNYNAQRELPLPMIYAMQDIIPGKQKGAILMQYLGDIACNVPVYESFTLKQLINAARCFARLHAYSLTLPASTFENLRVMPSLLETWVNLFKSIAPMTVAEDSRLESDYNKLKHLLETTHFVEYICYNMNKNLKMKTVLVHGDAWNNNIFVERNPDGSPGSKIVAFIDWQTVHGGNIGEDLARVMSVSNADIRREAEKVALDAYYDTFIDELKRRNLENPHTKAQVIKAYRQAYVHQALLQLVGAKVLQGERENLSSYERGIWEARHEILLLRCRLAVNDAVKIVEEDEPEWLNPNYEFPK